MSATYDAVVAGHLCLDMLPDLTGVTPEHFRKTFTPGHLLVVGPMSMGTGGPVSNTGLALHKLGIRVGLMGKTGDDLFGHAVREIVGRHGPGLADSIIVDPHASTSYTVIVNPPGIDRYFLHAPGANDTFTANDIRYDVVAGARLFHFGYPPIMRSMYADGGEQLSSIYRRVKEMGVTTSLDMAMPDPQSPAGRADWRAILQKTLPHVDVFLPSIEEMLLMVRRETWNELAQAADGPDILPLITPQLLCDLSGELLDMGARVVGLKLGYRGLYLRTADAKAIQGMGRAAPTDNEAWAGREMWSPCFKANVVGTAGSGDSTIAGFLAALLRNLAPEDALTAAVAVGGCNVEAADTLSGVRPWDETLARVAAGWQKHDLRLEAPGWREDAGRGIWQAAVNQNG